MANIGFIADSHGDNRNIELITKAFKLLNIDDVVHLGDHSLKHMSDYSLSEVQKAQALRDQIQKETKLREDVKAGLISKRQLEQIVHWYDHGVDVSAMVAEAEGNELVSQLSQFGNYTILSGNHDHKSLEKIAGDAFLNGSMKNIGPGIKALGLSGGGSPPNTAVTEQIMADDPNRQGEAYVNWQNFVKPEMDAKIVISHIQPTDGKHNVVDIAAHRLESLILRRGQAGMPVPEFYFHGHQHGPSSVTYREHLGPNGAIQIKAGCSSRFHNSGDASFITAQIDEGSNVQLVTRYRIDFLGTVWKDREYKINMDAAEKVEEIEFEKNASTTVIKGQTIDNFVDNFKNLSLDKHEPITRERLDLNYNAIREPHSDLSENQARTLDHTIRTNITKVRYAMEEIDFELRTAFANARTRLHGDENQFDFVELIEEELLKLVCESNGIDYDAINESRFADNIRFGLLPQFTGLDYSSLVSSLEHADFEDLEWESKPIQDSKNAYWNNKVERILYGVSGPDFRAMANLYVPDALEPVGNPTEQDSRGLWIQFFQKGLIDTETAVDTNFYEFKEGYQANPMSDEEITDMFGTLDDVIDTPEINQMIDSMRNAIRNGTQVFKDEEGEFLISAKGDRVPLDEAVTQGLDYQARDFNNYMGENIRRGAMPVVSENGEEFAYLDKELKVRVDREAFGLQDGDYVSMPSNNNYQIPEQAPDLDLMEDVQPDLGF